MSVSRESSQCRTIHPTNWPTGRLLLKRVLWLLHRIKATPGVRIRYRFSQYAKSDMRCSRPVTKFQCAVLNDYNLNLVTFRKFSLLARTHLDNIFMLFIGVWFGPQKGDQAQVVIDGKESEASSFYAGGRQVWDLSSGQSSPSGPLLPWHSNHQHACARARTYIWY